MPLINFQCKECALKFSELVYSRNKASVRCPECGGEVKQIYEGKCNSLSPFSTDSPESARCDGCSMGCEF